MGQEALPGCSFCSEVASARTGAGGHGVWATRGKWSEGSGSGPAFPLKAKGLESPTGEAGHTQQAVCSWATEPPTLPTSQSSGKKPDSYRHTQEPGIP